MNPITEAINSVAAKIQLDHPRIDFRLMWHNQCGLSEGNGMPVISMFYGIVIRMYFLEDARHGTPHIHARYAPHEASIRIDDGEVLAGKLPRRQLRLVQAWIELHRDELMADWDLAVAGEMPYKINPL